MTVNNTDYISLIDNALESYIPEYNQLYSKLYESIKYRRVKEYDLYLHFYSVNYAQEI